MSLFARISVMLAVTIVVTGCGETTKLYEGEKPKDKVATLMLSTSLDFSSQAAKVRAIDGVPVSPMEIAQKCCPASTLLPARLATGCLPGPSSSRPALRLRRATRMR
jgi:hypothetical protein